MRFAIPVWVILAVVLSAAGNPAHANLAGDERPAPSAAKRVSTERVRLLTSQDDLQNRTTVDDFVKFIKAAEAKAYPILATNPAAARIRVQFDCQPGRCEVQLSVLGDPRQPVLDALFEAMKSLPPLETIGEASFQVQYRVDE